MNLRRPSSPRSATCSATRGTAGRCGPAALVAAAVVAALLTGCTVEPPEPAPDAPVVAAVVSEAQEREILNRVSDVVAAADDADGTGSLAARLSGPALAMREAELKLATARGDQRQLTDLTPQMQQIILPSEQGWPRTSYAVGVRPAGKQTPVLVAFEQATAREQYKLWGYVHLVPGAAVPQFAEPASGSPAVAQDDPTLTTTPRAAVEQYASVLTADEQSQYAENFADDDLRQFLRDYGRLQIEAIKKKDGNGTFEVAYESARAPVRAVRTTDGGALVLAALASQEKVEAEENWQLGPTTPSAKALWGDAGRTNLVRIAYREMVALYVPPAGSAERMRLVGHHRVAHAVANR